MATNYTRGRGLEYACRTVLERHGFWVIRAAGSKGVADLVASKRSPAGDAVLLLVQCKLGGGGIDRGEWNTLVETAYEAGGMPVLAWRAAPRARLTWHELTGLRALRQRRPTWPWRPLDLSLFP